MGLEGVNEKEEGRLICRKGELRAVAVVSINRKTRRVRNWVEIGI